MKSFESVFNKLNELFIEKLPEYIRSVNEEHNDEILIEDFSNKSLTDSTTHKAPYFEFTIENQEYSEKDRILENTVFAVSFALNLELNNKILQFWRYVEAIQRMFDEAENEAWQDIQIIQVKANKLYIKITCEGVR